MPVTADQPAPYAPASALLTLIDRHRNKGLPSPIDGDVLARAGVSPSLIARTLQALGTLDLITEDGKPSQVLEGLRLAPESEYKQRMGEWLNSAYADAIQFVDPATADETQLRDAFRSYKPVGQQTRMVSLFSGLFAAAGVGPERQKVPVARKAAVVRKPLAPAPRGAVHLSGHIGTRRTPPPAGQNTGLPPALSGLLASLPQDGGGWTKTDRDRFVATFGAVLDFCYPVVAAGKQKQVLPEGED